MRPVPPKAASLPAKRGEIWLVDFGDPIGHEQGFRRPAVVVSADRMNRGRSGLVIVVPCTTARRGLPTHVELDPDASGLAEVGYAKAEDVKSVSVGRLRHRLGVAPHAELARIVHLIRVLLEG